MSDFFNLSNEMLVEADARGYFTRINRAWTVVLGWSAEELLSRPYFKFVHPDDLAATIQEAQRLSTGTYETIRFTNRYRCRDGSYRWLEWTSVMNSDSGRILATARDVTEQRSQKELLLQSEERFRSLAAHAPIGIAQADAEGKVFYVNGRWCELAGIRPEETLGFQWMEFVHPDDLPGLVDVWQSSVRAGTEMSPHEFRIIHRSGAVRWASGSVAMVKGFDGGIVGQIATVQDISQRKQSEEALRAGEERYRLLADHADDFVSLNDLHGNRLYVSPSYFRVTGWTWEDLDASDWRSRTHPDDVELVEKAFAENIAGRCTTTEHRIRCRDGSYIWVELHCKPLLDPAGDPRQFLLRSLNITARKHAEEDLRLREFTIRQLFDLQEQERSLLSHDLHDGLAQYLFGAFMRLEALRKTVTEEQIVGFLKMHEMMSRAIAESRRLINDLRPMVIEDAGITESIRHLIADWNKTSTCEVSFTSDLVNNRNSPLFDGAVFRIVQEAGNNALRHGRPSRLAISLSQENSRLWIDIDDDGSGFNLKDVPASRFGIRGIMERARLFGGSAAVASAPGRGTKIHVELVIPDRQPSDGALHSATAR